MSVDNQKNKQFIEDRLVRGEELIESAFIHQGIYWHAIAVLILALIVGMFVVSELGILLLVVSAIMVSFAYARRTVYTLVLTNKRVLVRYGLLQMDVVDIHFDKIESIELERMLPGMIMGYSNVVVMGTGNRYICVPYVSNGPAIRKAYNEIVLGNEEDARAER